MDDADTIVAIVKDVLVSGFSDDDIRKNVLGRSELDGKTVKDDTVTFWRWHKMHLLSR